MFRKLNGGLYFLADEFLYSGHLQSLGAAGITYIASISILSKNPSLALLILIYLIFQSIFLYDRYRGIEKDRKTNDARTKHLMKYSASIPAIVIVQLLLVFVILVLLANISTFVFALTILMLGLLYPIYFKGLTKKIYLFKNFYVSGVYASLVFFPLVFYSAGVASPQLLAIYFVFVFIESLINQAALDSKDVASDKSGGLYTLPVLLGKEKSLLYLRYFSLFLGLIFLFISYETNLFISLNYKPGNLFVILVLGSLIINQLFLEMIYKNNRAGYALSAGKFFLWFLIALAFRLIL